MNLKSEEKENKVYEYEEEKFLMILLKEIWYGVL